MKAIDWSKEKVGMLQPLYISGSSNGAVWVCRCECGNSIEKSSSKLKMAKNRGHKNISCGCMKSNQIPSLNEAKKLGKSRYFTGRPCKNGHVAERRVKGRQCVECAKEKDLETRPKRIEYFKNYQKKNPDKAREASRKYNSNNREKRREENAKRRKRPDQKLKRAQWQRARENSKRGFGGRVSREEIEEIRQSQKNKCAECRAKLKDYHVDHIVPVCLGGSSDKSNLQLLCPPCNLRKGSKDPYEWAEENGRLL